MVDRFVSVPMILSDLERRDARGQIFRWISLITLVLFDLYDQIRQDTHVGDGHISMGSAMSLPQGGGAQAQPNFGSSLVFVRTPFDAELPSLTTYGEGRAFRTSATSLHLHKCVARFVSNS